MGSVTNDWKHLLRTETSQKSFLKSFYYNNKVARKVKDFQNSLIKKFTSSFNLIIPTTINLSNSIYGQTSLRQTIFSVLMYIWCKLLLISFRNALMDSYIFCVLYKIINFSLPLNPAIHRMGNTPNILCPRCKEQKESQPLFHILLLSKAIAFYFKLSKITESNYKVLQIDFISELSIWNILLISLSKLLSKPSKWELLLNSMMLYPTS